MLVPTLVRYLLISAFTFGLDLVLLTLVHSGLGWPLRGAEGIFMFSAMRWFVFTAAPSEDQDRAPVS